MSYRFKEAIAAANDFVVKPDANTGTMAVKGPSKPNQLDVAQCIYAIINAAPP